MVRALAGALLALCFAPSGGAWAQEETVSLADPSQAARIERVERTLPPIKLPDGTALQLDLAAWMETLRVSGLSVAVFDNFRIVWRKSYGVREAGKPAKVTLDTTFQAGSVSKPLTAIAVMHLVQEGRLNLDENVNDKLRSWKVPENEFTKKEKVTLRRLLSHSAGLSVHGFPGYEVGAPVPTLQQMLDGQPPANTAAVRVIAKPGGEFSYSGGGTTIVQQLLIDVLKKPFPQIMAETVLQPLGLLHSSFEEPQPPERAAMSATAHSADGKVIPGKWHIYPEMAAAGLWTTPGDLAQVAIEVAKSKQVKSNRVLSQKTVQQMLTVQAAPLGIGFFVDPKSDFFGHNGDDAGFHATLVAFAASGRGAVIMVNSDYGYALFAPLMASIAKEYGWTSYVEEPLRPFLRFILVSRQVGATRALDDYLSSRSILPFSATGPGDLNAGGYDLLGSGHVEDAIRIFQANVKLYPGDANAYDSLAEAYMAVGNKELSIANYSKSLELNPKNQNAIDVLAKLGVIWRDDAGAP